jgi:hypothetical protein
MYARYGTAGSPRRKTLREEDTTIGPKPRVCLIVIVGLLVMHVRSRAAYRLEDQRYRHGQAHGIDNGEFGRVAHGEILALVGAEIRPGDHQVHAREVEELPEGEVGWQRGSIETDAHSLSFLQTELVDDEVVHEPLIWKCAFILRSH